MKNLLMTVATVLIVASPPNAFAFQAGAEGCSSDCSTCHSLTEKEAGELLKLKDVKISDSPAKGIWQVEGTQGENRVRVYLDFAKEHVMLISRFISVDTIGKPPEVRKLDLNDIPLTGTVLVGSKKARHKVIVFSDPDCPYCRKLHGEIKKVVKKRKDIAFYVKPFPLPMHKEAYGK
ncbi:MAG: thioredoxin domain-containing protein, partial [bacterium]|nr:thioredoxin domain-containing protein [bacterium]